ncbi:MAG TPA: SpoIIE family protein phosphatase [Candidatus Limiplasma sp.]|nr:SpoIIE family protein phosphatase [Candidatus Limiplasma sp.]HRX08447.1 SpoIIE family protein phosphatase [Candidatus Limiplasma sp.]
MNEPKLRLYTELLLKQVNKKHYRECGDQAEIVRTMEHTDFVLADGVGSGSYANIAARMCISRVLHLMRSGISIHKACEKALTLMHRARTERVPFAAFNIARIMKNGQLTALSFEAPLPLLIRDGIVQKLRPTHYTMSNEVVTETSVLLKEGDSMVFFTDGVTQAGLGRGHGMGWGTDGFMNLYQKCISAGMSNDDAFDMILMKTKSLSGNIHGDDTSIALLTLRKASVINILTGPPANKMDDEIFVKRFLACDGLKVVCGSTTADMVARVMGKRVKMQKITDSLTAPPEYTIDGIDLVMEGAVTLNQVYNILEEDLKGGEEGVCKLCLFLKNADIVRFFEGQAENTAHNDITFKQLGILKRAIIVQLLDEKLKKMGKVTKMEKL